MQYKRSIALITLPLAIGTTLGVEASINSAEAQIVPDGTLGAESSVVTPDVEINGLPSDQIDGGATRGANLFHSFQEFNVGEGRGAYFSNPDAIENILSRVTGSNLSKILGTLGVLGDANLFFINPNGIVFGPNARLDIGGSFVSSTADSLVFENGFEFSSTDPQAPPLLTINIPIGLNFRDNPGDIVNRSFVQNNAGEFVGLEVVPGENLTLVGGNINFEAGEATASGGNIELGGLSEAGTVDINDDGSLSFPEDVAKSDITLSNAADVDVRGTGRGSITINARNLNLEAGDFGGSLIRGGITADSTSADAQAGNIIIDVSGNITLNDSRIVNQVNSGGVGNSGNIIISTASLEATNGGDVDASTFGQGNAGSVEITASDTITFDGEDSEGFASGATSLVNSGAVGDAGGVTITTGSLNLTNGGRVSASTFGQGNAGSVEITATDTISVDGEDPSDDETVGGIFSTVGSDAVGNAGGVEITTGNLTLTNAGTVSASTFGRGNAGSVTINASDTITIDGEDLEGFASGAFSQVNSGAVGDAGGVTIDTGSLNLTNGGVVSASTFGQGNAGSVEITASDTITIDGEDSGGVPSLVDSRVEPEAVGNAGGVTITTGSLNLTNGGRVSASTLGQGDAGNVIIKTGQLLVSDGAQISASTSGAGDGGNLTIHARQGVELRGTGSETFDEAIEESLRIGAASGDLQELLTTAPFSTATVSTGGAGKITIDTPSLVLKDGAILSSTTFGEGEAGRIVIENANSVELIGSGLVAGTFNPDAEKAAGGSIEIETGKLSLQEGGRILTTTFGKGEGGNVDVRASESVELGSTPSGVILPTTINASSVFSTGPAGDITIETPKLIVQDGAQIVTTSGSDSLPDQLIQQGGSGGNIDVTDSESVEISGISPDGRFSSILTAESFSASPAGDLSIETGQMTVSDEAQVTVSSSPKGSLQGQAGNLKITANSLSLDRGSITAETEKSEAEEEGANITLHLSDLLTLSNESLISSRAFNTANGGNIDIDTPLLIAFPPEGPDGSDIIAKASEGSGGQITITAQGIFGIEEREAIPGNQSNDIDASSEFGLSGTVTISSPEVEPDRGLVELPENVVDPAALIAQNPCKQISESEFIITGRGGLPPSPNQVLSNDSARVNWVDPAPVESRGTEEQESRGADESSSIPNPQSKIPNPIVPARGWVFNEKGEVILVSYDPTNSGPQRSRQNPPVCPTP